MQVGGQCHALAVLPPGKRPGTHSIGGWVCPRASLNGAESFIPTGIKSLDHYAIPNMLSQTTYQTYNLKI
jgi:hypothetical protein